MKFYLCESCKNIVMKLQDNCDGLSCCGGQKMKELIPAETDGAFEKHVPAVTVENNIVKVAVGEVAHPMMDAHYIQFIVLETTNGFQVKYLKPNESPETYFVLAEGESAVAASESCNVHGLWKKEI